MTISLIVVGGWIMNPKVVLAKEVLDIGKLPEPGTYRTDIVIVNTGIVSKEIAINPKCGCAVSDKQKFVVYPGFNAIPVEFEVPLKLPTGSGSTKVELELINANQRSSRLLSCEIRYRIES